MQLLEKIIPASTAAILGAVVINTSSLFATDAHHGEWKKEDCPTKEEVKNFLDNHIKNDDEEFLETIDQKATLVTSKARWVIQKIEPGQNVKGPTESVYFRENFSFINDNGQFCLYQVTGNTVDLRYDPMPSQITFARHKEDK